MFSLAVGIYQNYFATPQLNVLLIGTSGVGKTTLLERLKVTEFTVKPKPQADSEQQQQPANEDDDDNDTDSSTTTTTNNNNNNNTQQQRQQQIQPQLQQPSPVTSSFQTEFDVKPGHKMLPLNKIRPTSGQNLAKIEICGARCHIFDVGGSFQSLWKRYYNDCDAVIFCWQLDANHGSFMDDDDDDDDKDKATNTTKRQTEILEHVRSEIADGIPFLIFGHVFSPTNALPPLTTNEFLPHYSSNMMRVYCGSAKTGQGVRDAMEWLIPLAKRQAKLRNQMLEDEMQQMQSVKEV